VPVVESVSVWNDLSCEWLPNVLSCVAAKRFDPAATAWKNGCQLHIAPCFQALMAGNATECGVSWDSADRSSTEQRVGTCMCCPRSEVLMPYVEWACQRASKVG
jgi:hypothetical protein